MLFMERLIESQLSTSLPFRTLFSCLDLAAVWPSIGQPPLVDMLCDGWMDRGTDLGSCPKYCWQYCWQILIAMALTLGLEAVEVGHVEQRVALGVRRSILLIRGRLHALKKGHNHPHFLLQELL
ncbi:hypothetical protein EYF80_033442 [Liparis tanakae]|uniref:Uncharacterized protein n=1 Tax=Liparis tanakae TaxID=230148 RepID=A0A4Z2GSQ0_9TELE|nr:hypothetical protein EYF80_033442 [Liparis tanakae]